jgi:putative ABC transport system substrate-binding protein
MANSIRRRDVITLAAGAATAWPLAARAQQPGRVRRIGVLMGFTAGDAEGLERARTIAQELQNRGWTDNYSARIDYRWPGGDTEQIQALARELVSLSPDVLIADGTAAVWHYGR